MSRRRRSFTLALAALVATLSSLVATFSSFAVAAAAHDDPAARTRKETPAPMPFEPTEQLVYVGEFTRLFLRGIKIAEFKFTAARADGNAAKSGPTAAAEKAVDAGASRESTGATPRLVFVGDVKSEGWFQKLFNIDFHFHVESLVERDTFSVLRTTKLDEQGKRVRTSEAVFDRAEKKVSWTELDPNDPERPPRVVTSALEGAAHDILSAIYFLRTQTLTPGKNLELTLSDSGRVYRVPATVTAEHKPMKTVLGRVSVVRLDVGLFGEGRPVEGDGKMSLWVTTDARRIPVRARMSSDIGMLDIKLKRVSTNPSAETQTK